MYTENLPTLRIHKLSQEQYDREAAAGNIEDFSLYLTPESDYVVATGEPTENCPWFWRKWSNGIAELWLAKVSNANVESFDNSPLPFIINKEVCRIADVYFDDLDIDNPFRTDVSITVAKNAVYTTIKAYDEAGELTEHTAAHLELYLVYKYV